MKCSTVKRIEVVVISASSTIGFLFSCFPVPCFLFRASLEQASLHCRYFATRQLTFLVQARTAAA
jgi:hypothetical protein